LVLYNGKVFFITYSVKQITTLDTTLKVSTKNAAEGLSASIYAEKILIPIESGKNIHSQ